MTSTSACSACRKHLYMCREANNHYVVRRFGFEVEVSHRVPSAMEIRQYAQQGIKLIVSDVDSTLTDGHEGRVCPDASLMVQRSHNDNLQVAIVSNNADEVYISSIANKLGVAPELTFTPRSLFERKPASTMVQRAIEKANVSKEEVLAIGDGVTDLSSFLASGILHSRIVLTPPREVGGYPLRSQLRTVVHRLGRVALPYLENRGALK